jgi:hypothetical protein
MKSTSRTGSRSIGAACCALALFVLASGTAAAFTRPLPFADTSTPTNALVSYFNAVDRGEYERAYGYLMAPARVTLHQFEVHWAGTLYAHLDFARVAGYVQASPMQASVCVDVRLHVLPRQGKPLRYRGWYTLVSTTGEEPNFGGWRIDLGSSRLMVVKRGADFDVGCHVV